MDNISGREDRSNDGLKQAVESGVVREPDNAALLLAAAAQTSTPLFSKAATIFLGGLFVLAVFAALRDASVIILPFVLAFILNLLLQPALRLLKRLRLPAAVGSLLLIVLIIAGLVGFGTALSGPAAVWAAKLPEGIPRLVEHVRLLRGPFDALQRILQQAELIAA